jgi:hypothetical protein
MADKLKVKDKVKLHDHPYHGINDEGVIIDIEQGVNGNLYEVAISYVKAEDQVASKLLNEGSELLFLKKELTKI